MFPCIVKLLHILKSDFDSREEYAMNTPEYLRRKRNPLILVVFDFLKKLGNPPFDAGQAAIQGCLLFRDSKEVGFMKVWINNPANINGVMTQINYSPTDDVILMLIVATDQTAKYLIHKQASIFA